MADAPSGSIAVLLLQALENERALDIHFRDTAMAPEDRALWMPLYKPMAQIALRRRFGRFYGLFIAAAVGGIAALQIVRFIQAMLFAIFRPRPRAEQIWMLPTVPGNRTIIGCAMRDLAPHIAQSQAVPDLDARASATALGVVETSLCGLSILRLYWIILTRRPGQRLDLLLHARDAVSLALLTRFARRFPEIAVWTDDHYQRWAFLLSRTSSHLSIVQHGFLHGTISFPHPFGAIERLAVRAERFVPLFEAYFQVGEWRLFNSDLPADRLDLPRPLLLLASSAPHIEEEIAFLERFRERSSMPIALKLHPAHTYDERRGQLVALADLLCEPNARPVADVFVSHSSYMALDYERLGAITCAIADHNAGQSAAEWVICRIQDHRIQ